MLHYHTIPVTAFQQNCSLVWCDQTLEAAVIDPGGDLDHILAQAQHLGVTLKAIWLTHAHIDHAGGTGELARRLDLPIVGHPTTSCAPSTLPVHQQALLAEDLPCWPCLRARQFKDHGPGDPLDPATTLPKSDERCRCTQVIRPGVGYEVSQVLFRLMKPVFETTYGAQRTPMPKLPQHRLPHQTHDSGIHTLNPHACNLG